LLGESGRVVCTKGVVVTEEHVGDDGQCRQDESGSACRETRDTRGPDVDGFSVAGVVEDFGVDVVQGAGEGLGLLVRRVEALCAVEDKQRHENWMGTCMPKSTMTMSLLGSVER